MVNGCMDKVEKLSGTKKQSKQVREAGKHKGDLLSFSLSREMLSSLLVASCVWLGALEMWIVNGHMLKLLNTN